MKKISSKKNPFIIKKLEIEREDRKKLRKNLNFNKKCLELESLAYKQIKPIKINLLGKRNPEFMEDISEEIEPLKPEKKLKTETPTNKSTVNSSGSEESLRSPEEIDTDIKRLKKEINKCERKLRAKKRKNSDEKVEEEITALKNKIEKCNSKIEKLEEELIENEKIRVKRRRKIQ